MTGTQNIERSLHCALARIQDTIPFVFHRVTSTFSPNAAFSSVQFDLAVHTADMRKVSLTFDTLFIVDIKPPFCEALHFIKTSRKHLWPVVCFKPTVK